MKIGHKKSFAIGIISIFIFILWTLFIQTIDVQPIGINGTNIGFSTFNSWFHRLTGANMTLYTITDWLGLIPIFVCMVFAVIGFAQLVKRRSIIKVDFDIIVLGIYYVIVILFYLLFEMLPINYRPILINGFMEASYPSSTTLLVLGVMPTLDFQAKGRIKKDKIKVVVCVLSGVFSILMVVGRLVSGVHWFTDIIGSIFLSAGLFYIYKGIVLWNLEKSFRN